MKILYVIHDFLPKHQAGAEIYTYLLAKEVARETDVLLFFTEISPFSTSYTVKKRSVDGLSCVEVFRPPVTDLATAPYNDRQMEDIFSTLLREYEPDIVHLQHLLYHSLRYPEIAKTRSIPIVFTLHDYWLTCPRWGQRLRNNMQICHTVDFHQCAECMYGPPDSVKKFSLGSLFTLLRRRSAAPASTPDRQLDALVQRNAQVMQASQHIELFIAPSPFLRDTFIDFGIPREKILFSDYGFDTGSFTHTYRDPGPRIRFGFIGTICEHKGVHVLVEAFNTLPAEKAELHIHGDLTWFPDYRARLDKLAASPAISFKGAIPNSSVADVLADIDVLVVPSIWFENSPLTIHEAFLAGVPVIASNIGGMADLVTDNGNGLLFTVNDPASLSEAMRKIIDSPSLVKQFREGIPPVKSIQENGSEMLQIYRQLLS